MHNVWLIAKREYLERVRTKAFLIATILVPLLFGGLAVGAGFLAQRTKSTAHIAVLSSDPVLAVDLKHELEQGNDSSMRVDLEPDDASTRSRLDAELRDSKNSLTGYLIIVPASEADGRPTFSYTGRSASDIATDAMLKDALKSVLTRERLASQNVPPADIDDVLAPVEIKNPTTGDTRTAFWGAYVLFILMYMVIMLYGMNTARSVIEEKTSRVFEVLLSTIKSDEMLAGKLIGVGGVGLTQVGVWMLGALSVGVYFAGSRHGMTGHAVVSPSQVFFFVAYFLFGFFLYSSVAAGLGAMSNSEQEVQQLNLFIALPLVCCLFLLTTIIKSPDSTFSRVVSLIPFCSPLLMNFRISIGAPQPWEIGLSFVLMSLTILAVLWVSSRIYRVGILMYGKKPNLPEILRWLRYS